ncbi:MAG: hypothetical protein FWB96_01720 [Defluviitaleaceae bacterium]|nr:hypothetical protein [Defluviitaleaceae bacterium]MCL2263541.1 hypothetical protein [Defluviitaleaceae bacterium]
MVVNHNVPALFTHLSMRRSDRGMQTAMTRLSSGIRINSAREDAAGLAIANKLNYQVGGLNRASLNATHGISLIQTAEGALNEVHHMLQRMRELSVQAAHGTLTNENRAMIQLEIEELTTEIHSISRNTEYNRMRILNGEANRVIDNSVYTAGIMQNTRSIVSTLFVSHQVPPGRLDYTIEQAGRGAVVELIPDASLMMDITDPETGTTTSVFAENASLTINGRSFNMGNRTWESVRAEVNDALPFMGLSMYTGEGATVGSFFLVSNLAGESQRITISGNLELFGHPPFVLDANGDEVLDADNNPIPYLHTNQGRDARVTISHPARQGGLMDINGTPVAGSSLGNAVNGNNVAFRGSRGEDIRFNIQVMFDHLTGQFVFPNGNPIDPIVPIYDVNGDPVLTDPTDPTSPQLEGPRPQPIHMSKEFRDFGPIMLQIGPSHNTAMPVQIPRLNAESLGLVEYVGGRQRQIIDVRPTAISMERGSVVQVGAEAAIGITDAAILTVSNTRARLGAYQNRLESTVRNLDVAAENTEQSRSRIQDTDMARETTRFAQYNVMFQAAMSILAQANQRPQQIIQLLQ